LLLEYTNCAEKCSRNFLSKDSSFWFSSIALSLAHMSKKGGGILIPVPFKRNKNIILDKDEHGALSRQFL